MTSNHLLSASLFAELFQHNLVSPDGLIIANDQQLRDYSTFLIHQSKDRVANLYAERKNLVNDVEELLRLDIRTDDEEELLMKLINELDLKFDEDGLLSMNEPRKPQKRQLGPKEPKKSIFERKIEAELERVKTLKRDLRKLEDWLVEISHFRRKTDQEEYMIDWKEAGRKYRERTANRMCDMENARKKLIKQHYKDYYRMLDTLLHKKLHKDIYLTRIARSKITDVKAPNGEDTIDAKSGPHDEKNIGSKYAVNETRVNVVKEDAEGKDADRKTTSAVIATDDADMKDEEKNVNADGKDIATDVQNDFSDKKDAVEIQNTAVNDAKTKRGWFSRK